MRGMDTLNPIEKLISRWPSRRAFADDVQSSVDAVHKWAQSGRIPSGKQFATLEAAKARGFEDVTPEWLLAVHAQQAGGAS